MTAPSTVFVVGCPRSGTTWIQLLLARHPLVATAPETQIFAYYLDWFRKQWEWEQEGPDGRRHGPAGLSRLLSAAEFDELCRGPAEFVLERIHRRNPGARVIVEKSPRHALRAAWIARLLPDARFLHLIRDPRDTAASLLAAGAGWASWAPRNPTGAATLWRECVEGARQVAGDDWRYREARYEEFREDPARELGTLFDWLDLPAGREFCERTVEECRLDRLRQGASGDAALTPTRTSPEGFFRRGEVGGWRDELPGWKVRIIEDICGPVMDELGYDRVGSTASVPLARIRGGLSRGVGRALDALEWRLRRLANRI